MNRALAAFRRGEKREALALAEAAWRMTEQIPGAPSRAAVVTSWYGYLLAVVGKDVVRGLSLCREASERVFWEPRIFEHLARVELEAGSRGRALDAVRRGLRLAPDDGDLRQLRRWLGMRRRPFFRLLGRSNPVNRLAGRFQARCLGGAI